MGMAETDGGNRQHEHEVGARQSIQTGRCRGGGAW